jgi:hypothetical protein
VYAHAHLPRYTARRGNVHLARPPCCLHPPDQAQLGAGKS